MPKPAVAHGIDREGLARLADGLIVALAISLPWSTSATSVLAVLWVFALLPTLRWADIREELATPAGGLPVLLVVLGLAGMVWADVTLLERWKGFEFICEVIGNTAAISAIPPLAAWPLGVGSLFVLMRGVARGHDGCRGNSALYIPCAALRQRVGEKRRNSKRRVCHVHLRPAVSGGRCHRKTAVADGVWGGRHHFSHAGQHLVRIDWANGSGCRICAGCRICRAVPSPQKHCIHVCRHCFAWHGWLEFIALPAFSCGCDLVRNTEI